MATAYQNLSGYDFNNVPDASEINISTVVAEWNENITEKLLGGTHSTLEKHGMKLESVVVERVPGSFEPISGAKGLAGTKESDAMIVLGCVVRGDAPHFDCVCLDVTQDITKLNSMYDISLIPDLLTTDTIQQSKGRVGDRYGNRGDEAAVTAIKVVNFPA